MLLSISIPDEDLHRLADLIASRLNAQAAPQVVAPVQMPPTKTQTQTWTDWFDRQKPEDQRTIALAAVERLVEMGDVRFRSSDPDEPEMVECLYWESRGDDLRIPF